LNEEGSQQPLPEEREPPLLAPLEEEPGQPEKRRTHGVIDLIIGVALLWAFDIFLIVVISVWAIFAAGVARPAEVEERLMTPGVFVVTQLPVLGWMFLVT
jgi:hypothetical protein